MLISQAPLKSYRVWYGMMVMMMECKIMEWMKWDQECSVRFDVSEISRHSCTVVNLLARLDCVYDILLVDM